MAHTFYNIPVDKLPKELIDELVLLAEGLFGKDGIYADDDEELVIPLTLETIEVAIDDAPNDPDSSVIFTYANSRFPLSEGWGALDITVFNAMISASIAFSDNGGIDVAADRDECESPEEFGMYDRVLKIGNSLIESADTLGTQVGETETEEPDAPEASADTQEAENEEGESESN